MNDVLRTVVTTTLEPTSADEHAAAALALRLGLPLVDRANRGLDRIFASTGAGAALVVNAAELALWVRGMDVPLRTHGALGIPRSRGLARGQSDPLVEACALRRGDRVVDATAGRCSDALVAEVAVGAEGEVVALESSAVIAAVMEASLRRAGSRIRLVDADYRDWLAAQPERSADVVYFDPMFHRPAKASTDFGPLRALADARPLTREALELAARVARRRVVLIDGPKGLEIQRLGLRDTMRGRWSGRRYGVLECPAGRARASD